MPLYAGIEGGGTKFIVIVADENLKIAEQTRVDTSTPQQTLGAIREFLQPFYDKGELAGIGVTCFGPLDLNRQSPTFGSVLSTPKPHWENFPLYEQLKKWFNLPIDITTDVNGSALAEGHWGGAKDVDNYIYMTIGTGIGIGAILNGKLAQGLSHFEAGHMLVPQEAGDDFKGVCPFHGNCLEGLASGPALKERWGVESALFLPPDHPAWELEAQYIASAIVNLVLCYNPQKVILGGGVMKQTQLLPRIRELCNKKMNGYTAPQMESDPEFVILQQLHDISGAYGAVLLAQSAAYQEGN